MIAPPPPYELPCYSLMLVYPVRPERLRPLLPASFEPDPVPVLREHVLVVAAYAYYNAHSVRGGSFLNYNEVAYATPVAWRDLSGLYYFRLDLNDPTACDAGRRYYGMPKWLGDVRFPKYRDQFAVEARELNVAAGPALPSPGPQPANPLLLRLEGHIEVGWLEGMGAQMASLGSHLFPVLRAGLQIHGRRTVRFRWEYEQNEVFPAVLRVAEFPWLESHGLLRRGEGLRPLLTVFAARSTVWLDEPVDEP